MVRRGAGNDAVPDDGLVGCVRTGSRRWPLGGHVHKHLFGVPGKQARQVGVEAELDDGVLFLLGGVVVRSSLDDLYVGGLEETRGFAGGQKVGRGDQRGDDEGDGGKKPEGIL